MIFFIDEIVPSFRRHVAEKDIFIRFMISD